MNEYEQYYYNCRSNHWQDSDPKRCGCKGNGWFLSEVDTWHQCSIHGANVPHPEDHFDDLTDEEFEGRVGAVLAELKLPERPLVGVLSDDEDTKCWWTSELGGDDIPF